MSPKIIHPSEPGLHQFSSHIEQQIVKAIQNVNTDIIVGTRASYNILVSKYASQSYLKLVWNICIYVRMMSNIKRYT